jgi:hypothetical protein
MARLDSDQVADIAWLLTIGVKQAAIATEFGVTTSAIEKISSRRSWRHILGEASRIKVKGITA